MDASEVIRRCRLLAACTEEPGHITRTFLSPPMRAVHKLVREWMQVAGMEVRVDAAGNIRGVFGSGPRIMIASHLDTVPHAGAFDGILGVMLAIALVERKPPCGIEVVGFSEEEGVRFGVPFIGSRALVGDAVVDAPVLEAIREFGLDPAQLPQAAIGAEVKAYLEFHIEQGPLLEHQKRPVGVVETIVGQARAEVRFMGKAGHAGTTPMSGRSDALAGAAEWIGVVEKTAVDTPELVATVGRLETGPGAANVIPAWAQASLDVRHPEGFALGEAFGFLRASAEIIAHRRYMSCTWQSLSTQSPVRMNAAMVGALCVAVKDAGYKVHRMVSGAGHDAMILARKVPAAMLFLRSPGGVSHHPDESVLPEDVEAALAVGMRFLEKWRPA